MIENVFSQFWTLELQDQGGRRFTVCDCCFLVHTQLLLPVSSCEGRGEEALWQLLLVYLFHHKGPILMTEPPPKCTLGIRFQHMNLGRHKHSVVSTMEHFHRHHLCYHLADSSFASWSLQESEVPRCLVINGCWVWENESQVLLSLVGTTPIHPRGFWSNWL